MSEQINTVTGEIVSSELATRDIGAEISGINSGNAGFYASVKGDDMEAKLAVASAMSNAIPLADNLNKPLNIKDVIIQEVQLANDVTGKLESAPRITLIDVDGTAYSATSIGVFQSVKQLLFVVGEPHTWDKPVAMFAVEEGVKPRRYTTLKYGKPSK